jgi:hypothetical protein
MDISKITDKQINQLQRYLDGLKRRSKKYSETHKEQIAMKRREAYLRNKQNPEWVNKQRQYALASYHKYKNLKTESTEGTEGFKQ